MPHEPKRRHSIQRKGKRRASIKLKVAGSIVCPNCGNPTLAHKVCKNCGFYKGVSVVKKSSKAKVTRS
ncbi:MAG TPA: 50S ribosomal protein L32 [Patescibacteria group bacterium]